LNFFPEFLTCVRRGSFPPPECNQMASVMPSSICRAEARNAAEQRRVRSEDEDDDD
jgi:hypothetical protein